MKILIAPMNWGLGHASRCVPLINKYIEDGCEVVIGGDGESLTLLRKHFPELRIIELPSLNLKYSKGNSQTWALARALPRIIKWIIRDHFALKKILTKESFDRIISDNRFGLYVNLRPKSRYLSKYRKPRPHNSLAEPETIYITHQLQIRTPKGLHWLEPMLAGMHRDIILKYTQCWIPDYAGEENLSGELSHKCIMPRNAKFIGPLSRFPIKPKTFTAGANLEEVDSTADDKFNIVAVLSGLEPQRTIFEKEIVNHYLGREEKVLIIRGKTNEPNTEIVKKNITFVPYIDDETLQRVLLDCDIILARSGYSTIMDLNALGCLSKAQLVATPGQPEQEYLAQLLDEKQQVTAHQ